MTVEHLVGLNVIDEAGYARYRQEMTPLLHAVGGDFRYDFLIAEVLKTEASHPINRVFVICFPDRTTSERFFADERYLAVPSKVGRASATSNDRTPGHAQ